MFSNPALPRGTEVRLLQPLGGRPHLKALTPSQGRVGAADLSRESPVEFWRDTAPGVGRLAAAQKLLPLIPMSLVVILIIALAAVALGLGLAYLPMRILMAQIAKNVTGPIRDFIARQRDRRTASRETPDRRTKVEPGSSESS